MKNVIVSVLDFCAWLCADLFRGFAGSGYKARNDLIKDAYEASQALPSANRLSVPWGGALGRSERLYLSIANHTNKVGIAERDAGAGKKKSYRVYYGREYAGKWFAEVWSVWKSGFLAAILGLPFVDLAGAVSKNRGGEHAGLLLLISGLLLLAFFLPRAILGRNANHLIASSIASSVNGGSYGAAGVINTLAALGGIHYVFLALISDWSIGASLNYVTTEVLSYPSSIGVPLPVLMITGLVVGLCWTILPALFFWFASLRFTAARNVKSIFEDTSYSQRDAELFDGSSLSFYSSVAGPQVLIGWLLYMLTIFGFLLGPIVLWLF